MPSEHLEINGKRGDNARSRQLSHRRDGCFRVAWLARVLRKATLELFEAWFATVRAAIYNNSTSIPPHPVLSVSSPPRKDSRVEQGIIWTGQQRSSDDTLGETRGERSLKWARGGCESATSSGGRDRISHIAILLIPKPWLL